MENTFDLRKFITENRLTSNTVNEELDTDLLKRAQAPVPNNVKRKSPEDKGLRVSMGPNAEEEQKVIDIAKDAIALMDEQPGTDAITALNSVIENI